MNNILLTIAIPTFNRSKYVDYLLPKIVKQCDDVLSLGYNIELLICNNASTDNTEDIINKYTSGKSYVVYKKNSKNIGGDRNFINCVGRASGEYIWIFGDDDIIYEDAVKNICKYLEQYKPLLVISRSKLPWTKVFGSYKKAIKWGLYFDSFFALRHTLISCNIFKKSSFDIKRATNMLSTNYAHMYAMMDALSFENSRTVVISKKSSLFTARRDRAPFAEPVLNIETKIRRYHSDLSDSLLLKRLRVADWLFFNIINHVNVILNPAKACIKKILLRNNKNN